MILADHDYQSWITPLSKQGNGTNVGLAVTEVMGRQGRVSIRLHGLESWRDCPEAGSCYRAWLVAKTMLGPTIVSLGPLKTDAMGQGAGDYDINLEDVGETGRSIEEFTHLMVTVQSPDDLWPGAEAVVTSLYKPGQLAVEASEQEKVEIVEEQEVEIIADDKEFEGEDMRSLGNTSEEFEGFQPFDSPLPDHKWWKISD